LGQILKEGEKIIHYCSKYVLGNESFILKNIRGIIVIIIKLIINILYQFFFSCTVQWNRAEQNIYFDVSIVSILYDVLLRLTNERCEILKAVWLNIEWILLRRYFFTGDGTSLGYKTRPAFKTELQHKCIHIHATFQGMLNSIIWLAQ
jgi:hypothetical protein